MKHFSVTLILAFILNLFTPLVPFVSFEEQYSYATSNIQTTLEKWAPIFATSASREPTSSVIAGYSYSGSSQFEGNRNSFVLKIAKDESSFRGEDSLRVVWKVGERVEVRHLDLGKWPDSFASLYSFTEPAAFPGSKEVSYSIESDTLLDGVRIEIVATDTASHSTKITFDTETVHASVGGTAIISRKDWGADETLRYADGAVWKAIIEKNAKNPTKPTAAEIARLNRNKEINAHLGKNFPEQYTLATRTKWENEHELIWPIETVKQVDKIVLHHTDQNNPRDLTDEELIRAVYAYHAITRAWGDIGYNYIVGQRGKIYEGRAGGDYAVAAHAIWNNRGAVGISVIGNFQSDIVVDDQLAGIRAAIKYVSQKYGIDLSKQSYGHKECPTTQKCLTNDTLSPSLVGHRDVWSTACPGANLYKLISKFRSEATYSFGYTTKLNPLYGSMKFAENDDGTTLMATGSPSAGLLWAVADTSDDSLPKWRDIRILLSYPKKNTVTIEGYTAAPEVHFGTIGGQLKANVPLTLVAQGSNLTLVLGKKRYKVGKEAVFSSDILRVKSWDRKPSWDTSGNLNDNLFRGTIRVRANAWKIELVNILPLESYLRGLAEISNNDPVEKMKAILVAARGYAYFYTDPAHRKFPWKDYDGSDDPEIFQKYLGYGYEMRSPNTTKYLNETNGIVITYKGEVIKPWYFSESDGRTRSYKEYCELTRPATSSIACEDIPYLQWNTDPGGAGHTLRGHWVGLSGIGATYFATNLEWSYEQILGYYYADTDLKNVYSK